MALLGFHIRDTMNIMGDRFHVRADGDLERIVLRRGGDAVSSLIGAFGAGLRETRLTASLGYLLAVAPNTFMEVFGFGGNPVSVYLETRHDTGRSDIIVETSTGRGIIEAKVTAENASEQVTRYPAKWRVMLTQYMATRRERAVTGYRYLNWHDLSFVIRTLVKHRDTRCRFVARDLLLHLEEHGMISPIETAQIYAREINNQDTLAAFLHSRLYFCDYERGGGVPKMTYFAPHFGQAIAQKHPGIRCGISYIAKILGVELVEEWGDVRAVLKRHYGRQWKRYEEPVRVLENKWNWSIDSKRTMLVLGEPRLVFNPPIPKNKLQRGYGFLSKRFFSFDDLFAAWSV